MMHREAKILVAAVALLLSSDAFGQQRALEAVPPGAGRRLALVIGNDKYPQQPLRNAVADARAMVAALQKFGFAVGPPTTDATLKEFAESVDRFVAQIRPGDVALVYYAGHGMQVDGDNYLIPIDFAAQSEVDAKYDAYSATRIVDKLAASPARMSVVILDACRNNPFRSTRSGTRGLAAMESGRGTLIAFATAPNSTAADNPAAANGLFTMHLLEAMNEPGAPIEQVFSRVRQKVYEASGGSQTPWLVSSIIGEFSFRPPAPNMAAAEEKLWKEISGSESADAFRRYLEVYPHGTYSRLAKLYIDALTRLGAVTAPAAAPATGAPAASNAAAAASAPRAWQPYFIKAQNGVTYIPFLLPLDVSPAVGPVGVYVRAVRANAAPGAVREFPWDDYVELTPTGSETPGKSVVANVMSLPAGEYDVFITFAERRDRRQRTDAIRDLVARVDSSDARVVRHRVSVPDFWDGRLAISSLLLARRVDTIVKAALAGRVTDGRGGSLSGAKLTVVNVDTNETTTVVSSDDGAYIARDLTPGAYRVRAELAGFTTAVHEGVRLKAGQASEVDPTLMKISAVTQVIVTEPDTDAPAAREPFIFGSVNVVPAELSRFGRNDELQVLGWVYNARPQPQSGKPDVKVEYQFFKRAAGTAAETFFNRTAPLIFNAGTLPTTFDASTHQLQAGNAIPLRSFEPGEYRLQVTATDLVSGQATERSVTFTVQ